MIRKTPLRSISEKRRAKAKSGTKTGMMRRSSMPRGKKVKARNPKRRASEFARCYHSRERVRWVKSLPCAYCLTLSPIFGLATVGECDNAHTVTEGMGRKAGYETIVPLCRSHHRRYDEHQSPFDNDVARAALRNSARVIETAWLAFSGRQERDA